MSYVRPIAYPDPPYIIDTSVTSIPALSSPTLMQIIEDTGVQTGVGVVFNDSTDHFIGVYVGPEGVEEILCIIGNGTTDQAWGHIPAHSRISLRCMTNTAATLGLLSVVVVTL